jgi:TRAP-type C4-dicarboxylate transport system permease large subunit
MSKLLVLLAIVLFTVGTAVGPEHKSAGAGLTFGALLVFLISINPIRNGLMNKRRNKSNKKGVVVILLVVVLIAAYFFGWAPTFDFISDKLHDFIQWLKNAADSSGKGRQA